MKRGAKIKARPASREGHVRSTTLQRYGLIREILCQIIFQAHGDWLGLGDRRGGSRVVTSGIRLIGTRHRLLDPKRPQGRAAVARWPRAARRGRYRHAGTLPSRSSAMVSTHDRGVPLFGWHGSGRWRHSEVEEAIAIDREDRSVNPDPDDGVAERGGLTSYNRARRGLTPSRM